MSSDTGSLLDKGTKNLRRTAAEQAKAYQSYSDMLARFGNGDLSSVGFAKEAVDLYYREAGRSAVNAFELSTELATALLAQLGIRVRDAEKTADSGSVKQKAKTNA
jgi:hypothetical protein